MKDKRKELIGFLTWADGEVFGIEAPYDEIIDAYFESIILRPDESGSVSKNEDEKKVYMCTVCQQVPVDVDNGYDTCQSCVERI